MFGGIAVAGNLLCLAHSEARGEVFLVDLEERRLISFWVYSGPDEGYADAGGVAIAEDFSILVADCRNDVVRRFTPFGKQIDTIGRSTQRRPGAARRDRVGFLDRPRAVAVHDSVVHVCCGERKLMRGVQRCSLDGRPQRPLRAFGEDEGRFGAPRGIHAGPAGVFVADTLHGVIQRFAQDGHFVSQFSTATTHDEASRPVAVVPLEDGDLLVADHGDRPGIRRFGIGGETRKPVPEALAELSEPSDFALDGEGRVYVLDRDGERVQRFTADLEAGSHVLDLAEILHE